MISCLLAFLWIPVSLEHLEHLVLLVGPLKTTTNNLTLLSTEDTEPAWLTDRSTNPVKLKTLCTHLSNMFLWMLVCLPHERLGSRDLNVWIPQQLFCNKMWFMFPSGWTTITPVSLWLLISALQTDVGGAIAARLISWSLDIHEITDETQEMMSRTFCPLWPRRPGCPGPPGCPGLPCRDSNRVRAGGASSTARRQQYESHRWSLRMWRWRTDLRSRETVYSSQSRIAFFPLASLQRNMDWIRTVLLIHVTTWQLYADTVTSSSCPSLTLCVHSYLQYFFVLFLFLIWLFLILPLWFFYL